MTQIKKTTSKISTKYGFTLIELIVTVGIFLFLTSLIMVNHSKFSGAMLLENLAYDVALSIRQAQVFGLSAKEFEAGTGEFQQGYGVYFDASTPTQYVLFADRPVLNSQYDDFPSCGVPGSECIETFTIRKGNRIKDFCATEITTGLTVCTGDPCPTALGTFDHLNILFIRPDPDAVMTSSCLGEVYSDMTLTIISPNGIERDIVTRLTGQISIPAAARHP